MNKPAVQVPMSLIRRILESLSETNNSQLTYCRMAAEINILWPSAATIGRAIVEGVEANGFAVADCHCLNQLAPEARDVFLMAILAHVGQITVHDDTDCKVLWDIKDRETYLGREPTFSERLGECPIHTDSAFAKTPEKYLCLFVALESPDGGGESVVIPLAPALKQLEAEPDGIRCISVLSQDGFPHRTPDVFASVETVVVSPVLGPDSTVRFRHDCIHSGFTIRPDLMTTGRLWAVEYFHEFLENRAARIQFLAQSGQLVVLNNLQALHARTNYQDHRRHLIRARLHPHL